MKKINAQTLLDLFDTGVYLKLANALLEILGGFIFLFAKPTSINNLVLRLTQHELIQDPKDVIANFLRHQVVSLTGKSELFTAFFLLSHGLIKGFLLIALLQKRLWAYPTAIVVFLGFIVYQMYQYAIGGSAWLIALSLLDIIVVILTYLEYNNIKSKK